MRISRVSVGLSISVLNFLGPNTKVRIKTIPICHQSDYKIAQEEAELTFLLEGSKRINRLSINDIKVARS